MDAMDGEQEMERQQWHPNIVRMRMVSLLDANLEQITRDESRRQVERDMAAAILADRAAYIASQAAEVEARATGVAQREKAAQERTSRLSAQAAERAAAAKEWPVEEEVAGAAPQTENEKAARLFAMFLEDLVPCDLVQVMKTQSIAGSKVIDGWTVNYHDPHTEIGLVAVWWGRGHFKAYVEMVGHIGRTAEGATVLAKVFGK